MIYPTVHLGGTAKGDLLGALTDAMATLQDAIVAVQRAAPNGRDYYPQGAAAINTAQAEHGDRLNLLEQVRADLEAIAIHISDAP